MAQALRGKVTRSVAREIQCLGNRRAQEGITEGVEDQRERALRHMMLFVADR
jgi:hypothetical protein